MKATSPFSRFAEGAHPRAILVLPALLAAVGASSLPSSALANSQPSPPRYSLSIVEGESTLPEDVIANVSASVHPKAPAALSIVRGGVAVARANGEEGAWLSQVPQVGDVVTLESPAGTTVGSVVYDGLPSIDVTVCAGSTHFSGQRSSGEELEGGYYSLAVHTDPYGKTNIVETGAGRAQVTVLSGRGYEGSFLAPLSIGQTVWATESLQTPLAAGAMFTYSSEIDRPVGACPAPPAAATSPARGARPAGLRAQAHPHDVPQAAEFGSADEVTINQAGTVVEDLYIGGGKLPAYASAKGDGTRPPRAGVAPGTEGPRCCSDEAPRSQAGGQGRRASSHRAGAAPSEPRPQRAGDTRDDAAVKLGREAEPRRSIAHAAPLAGGHARLAPPDRSSGSEG